MNLVEFLFAVAAVFGTTTLWYCWTKFVYGLEQQDEKDEMQVNAK